MALLQRFLNVPELSYGLLIGGLFLVVVGAERLGGLHGSLGALLFGAALSGLPHRMREDIMPGMRSTAEGLFVSSVLCISRSVPRPCRSSTFR